MSFQSNQLLTDELQRERARADEAAHFSRMLQSVVAASRALLDEPDFQRGVERWLTLVAEAVRADRAVLGQFAGGEPSRPPVVSQIIWTRPCANSGSAVPVAASADFERWAERLGRGETVWAQRDDLIDPVLREFWAATGCCTNLMVPVVVQQRTAAWVCFDWRERREEDPACTALVRAATDAAAAAIKRHEAVQAALAEREERAAELAAVNRELERRTRLLAASAQASALLSVCEHFDNAVVEAIGVVALAAEFDRARIVEYIDPEGRPDARYFRVTYEWRRGVNPPPTPSHPIQGTHDDMPVFAAQILQRDSIVDYRREELPDRATSALQQSMDARYYLAGSIWLDNRPWGAFGCDDYATDRRRTEEEKGVIAAAARSIGQAIYRRRLELKTETLQRQIFEEREQAARDRMAELAHANEALRRSTANLAGLADLSAFHESLLLSAAKITGARVTEVFTYDDRTRALRMTSAVREGKVVAIGEDPTMELWRHDMPEDVTRAWIDWVGDKEFSVIEIGRLTEESRTRSNVGWHIAEGHQLIVDVPLSVGGRLVGLLGLCFTTAVPPGTFALEQVRVLAQQAALAIQMARLAESGRQAAVQAERNRLVRDLHDTLAQGFTGVLAQLGAVEGAVEAGRLGEMHHYLERAKALARFSLAEARSSVHALRPETNAAPLAARLRQMLAGMTQGTGLDAALEESGEGGALGPAADWCVHKFVQEALANAVKHSGAGIFRVELAWGAEFSACVWDNGRGFDPAATPPGLGLLSMRERASEAGGRLTNESRLGAGARLCLTFPRSAFSSDAKTP